ncbi:MAG: hypothetical protein AAB491_01350 [Patescibacteria group bacterium]
MKKILIAMTVLSLMIISPRIINKIIGRIDNQSDLLANVGNSRKSSVFDKIEIEAKSAYVFDILSGKPIFELNSNTQLPLASFIKIMTSTIAKENIPDETIITILKEDLGNDGDDGLFLDERWTLSKLIDFEMAKSSNDASHAIARSVEQTFLESNFKDIPNFSSEFPKFLYLMNKKAKEIGMEQTYFLNETGLDISKDVSGAYGSAFDVAKIARYALEHHPEIFESTVYDKITLDSLDYKHEVLNTNKYVGKMIRILGSKTGYTELAGGNLVTIFDAGYGRPFIAVVMGSSMEGRFSDMQKLIDATYEWLQQK